MNISTFMRLAPMLPASKSVLVKGVHGIGKTEVINQIGKELGLRVVVFQGDQVSDVGDIIGLPKIVQVKERFAKTNLDGSFIKGHNGELEYEDRMVDHTVWVPPYWFHAGEPVLLFLDEPNRARPEITNCMMQLTLEHRCLDFVLPEGSRVYAAINPSDNGNYDVDNMDPAKLDRYWVKTLVPTNEEWLDWARSAGVHAAVLEYIGKNPNDLDPYTNSELMNVKNSGEVRLPSRRSWTSVSDTLLEAEKLNKGKLNTNDVVELVSGWVGNVCAVKFKQFYEDADNTVSAEEIIENYKKVRSRVKKMMKSTPAMIAVANNIRTYVMGMDKADATDVQKQNFEDWYNDLTKELKVSITNNIIYRSITKGENWVSKISSDDLVNNKYMEIISEAST